MAGSVVVSIAGNHLPFGEKVRPPAVKPLGMTVALTSSEVPEKHASSTPPIKGPAR